MTRATREATAVRVGGALMVFAVGVVVGAVCEVMDPHPEVLRTYSVDCPTEESCEPVYVDGRWRIEEVGP